MEDVAPRWFIACSLAVVLGIGYLGWRQHHAPPLTCADFADSARDNVPARCFADFRPERP